MRRIRYTDWFLGLCSGGCDDAVCSSPSSGSPASNIKSRKKNCETDSNPKVAGSEFSGKKVENGMMLPENVDAGKLGFKVCMSTWACCPLG